MTWLLKAAALVFAFLAFLVSHPFSWQFAAVVLILALTLAFRMAFGGGRQ